jgi:hypothetical protein
MHTVELLDEALQAARTLGYQIRVEALGGHAGACVVGGKKLLMLDLDDGPAERLDVVLDALRGETSLAAVQMTPLLARLAGLRAAA